jgi:hypothetical protein
MCAIASYSKATWAWSGTTDNISPQRIQGSAKHVATLQSLAHESHDCSVPHPTCSTWQQQRCTSRTNKQSCVPATTCVDIKLDWIHSAQWVLTKLINQNQSSYYIIFIFTQSANFIKLHYSATSLDPWNLSSSKKRHESCGTSMFHLDTDEAPSRAQPRPCASPCLSTEEAAVFSNHSRGKSLWHRILDCGILRSLRCWLSGFRDHLNHLRTQIYRTSYYDKVQIKMVHHGAS